MKCNHSTKYAKNLCKECYDKQWYENNKLREKLRGAKYYQNNKEKRRIQREKWRSEHKTFLKDYYSNRLSTDPSYKLKQYLRSRLYRALKTKQKVGSAVRDLGCSIEEFMVYLEQRFHIHPTSCKNMTWENYGEWEIDHIQELDTFDLTKREEFLQACHYTNLQPLWAEEHLIKTAEYMRKKFTV